MIMAFPLPGSISADGMAFESNVYTGKKWQWKIIVEIYDAKNKIRPIRSEYLTQLPRGWHAEYYPRFLNDPVANTSPSLKIYEGPNPFVRALERAAQWHRVFVSFGRYHR
jgi:hypothetical protein